MRIGTTIYLLIILSFAFSFVSCGGKQGRGIIDQLNMSSYDFHYRDIDSSMMYAQRALRLSVADGYDAGRAEAINNMAFVHMAKMEYDSAFVLLDKVSQITDNQLELLVADVQFMRLCQRRSSNKDFYSYRERAMLRMQRIEEERTSLDERQEQRYVYAQSEYFIVLSAYFYYIGLTDQSVAALENIDPNGDIVDDMGQLLNYYYNIGAGGIIRSGTKESICQAEFNYLMRCYLLSRQYNYPYWEANSLQAISEHLIDDENRDYIIKNNPQEIDFINVDKMPNSLLAGNIARRSLQLFKTYGDVYQIAGAYRTLGECYSGIADYASAFICLNKALSENDRINRAPDLVASIREQLSLVYSAVGDMGESIRNRQLYLEMQDKTRQDRQLEARAEQLSKSSRQLNYMILAVILMIFLVVLLMYVFNLMRRRSERRHSINDFLSPLEQWKQQDEINERAADERIEELQELTEIARQRFVANKKRNLEQRAKVSLANSILPFINRMEHEVSRLLNANESATVRHERYEYLAELTDQINEYNDALTKWIQLSKGELNLHIESFRLQQVFDIVAKSRMEFALRGIDFCVEPTDDVVKADKVLTLFMINTIAENARRHTPAGGRVTIGSSATDSYVEISVVDTGCGIESSRLKNIFSRNVFDSLKDDAASPADGRRHGFGLMNCKGIIDKYKKISTLFSVCTISAKSEVGRGSRFYFRLPKGIVRMALCVLLCGAAVTSACAATSVVELRRAAMYADSASAANQRADYRQALLYADSCMAQLNRYYRERSRGIDTMAIYSNSTALPAELTWFYDRLPTDYDIVLNIRNECAVAAIGIYDWKLYAYNNNAYTKLFKERSADGTLADYVHVMELSESNKNVAIIMLSFLCVMLFPAYYFLYYRHRIYYSLAVESMTAINQVLLSDNDSAWKLQRISEIWNKCRRHSVASARWDELESVVQLIKQTLRQKIERTTSRQSVIESAEDELQRVEMDNNKTYVSNSVLDNCLSTLKHETMYYPSRIKQLIDGTDTNLHAIDETLNYYKELYTILTAQASRQIASTYGVDRDIVAYMFDILRRLAGEAAPAISTADHDDRYVRLSVALPSVRLTAAQRANLFTPLTVDVRYLLLRQIVREIGESQGARACGIQATRSDDNSTTIEITITKSVWTSLKS